MKRSLSVPLSLVLLMIMGFSGPAGSETPKTRAIARP